MILDEAGQALDETFGAAMRMGDADMLEVLRDGIGDLAEGSDFAIPKDGARFIVDDTEGAKDMAGGAVQGDLGVEAEMGPADDVGAIPEEFLLGKVPNDEARRVGSKIGGVDHFGGILAGKERDGMGADPPDQVQGADPKVDAIAGVVLILIP